MSTVEAHVNGARKRGPVLSEIDEEKVGKHLQKLGVEPTGDKRSKVEKLIRAFGELKEPNGQKPRLAHCDTCNCDSPPASMGYDDCPFCGDAEMDDEMQADAAKAVHEDEKDPADESLDGEIADGEEAEEADMTDQKSEEPKQAQTSALAVRSRKAARGAPEYKAPEQTTLSTAQDLDSTVKRVLDLSNDIRLNGWMLGKELAKIYDGKLWETRKDAKGKKVHNSFAEFLRAECHMERGTAEHLMDVSLFSEDEVRQFGYSKCSVLVRLPPEKRAERMERIRKDEKAGKRTTYRELLAEVRQTAQPRPTTFKGKPAWEGKIGPGSDAAKQAEKLKITAVLMLQRHRVPLFQGRDKEIRARKLADDPRGELSLANGVLASFRVATDASGELFVTFEVTRDAAAKPEKKAKKPVSKEKAIASAKKQTRKAVSKANATREKAAKKIAAKRTKKTK